jgi:S1-C subfamily serine protease
MSSNYDRPAAAGAGQAPPSPSGPGAGAARLAGYGADGYRGPDGRVGYAGPVRSYGGPSCPAGSAHPGGYGAAGPAYPDGPAHPASPAHPGSHGAPAGHAYPDGPAYPAAPAYPAGAGYPADPAGSAYPARAGYPAGSAGYSDPSRPGYPGGPAGPGYPGGYGIPAGHSGGGHQAPGGPARRFRRPVAMAAVTLAVGLATFLGLQAASIGEGSAVLTTVQIAGQTDPGLVDVVSTLGYQQAEAAGTGLVLTSSGEVLTNNHVINGATSIKVTDIGNGRTYPAKVMGYDTTKDLAVLQLQGASGLQTVNLGDSSTVAVGQKVVALGNAEGKGGTPSVATGKITGLNSSITASDEGSGTSEQLSGLINDNAPIQPGDSGGPLVNTAGQVIGIDTAASSSSSPNETAQTTATEAFAIPINEALSIASQIEAGHGSATVHISTTGFLGVQVTSASNATAEGVPSGSGALIAGVLPGGAAQNAGITAGDVITSVDGQSVSSPSALQAAMEQHHPGDSVRIGWTDQSGQAQSATVTLATGPAA